MNRPLHSAVLPVLLAAVAGFGLWTALATRPLVAGTIGGAVAGLAAGGVLARPGGEVSTPVRIAAAIAVGLAGLVAVTLDVGILGRIGGPLAAFLTVGLPAAGLADLAAVPYVVVAPVATAAAWAGLRNRPLVAVAAPTLGLVAVALLAAPVGVPWWVPALFGLVLGIELLVVSREHYTDMEPLVGTSTAIRRQLPWWRPAVVILPAAAVGVIAMSLPMSGAFDVRRFVSSDVVVIADENPLATAARLRHDPPTSADGIDVSVDVVGASPGRLRVAVLDQYAAAGWRQRAEFVITGETLALDPVAGVDPTERQDVASSVTIAQGPATSGLSATPTAGTPVGIDDPDGVRFAPSAALFLTDPGAGLAYRTVPSADIAPAAAGSAPAGVPGELYRCPDSPVIDDIADTLAQGGGSPLDRLRRIEAWLKLTKIYDPLAPGGQTQRSVELFLTQELGRGNLEVFVTAFALLARCADVPVRVVVGYPQPAADGRTEYTPTEITAWVETPVAGRGWVPLDPVPTPAEQQRQAELARQPERSPADPPPAEPPAAVVEPTTPTSTAWWAIVLAITAAVVAIAALLFAAAVAVRRRTLSRRRRVADPATAVRLAWRTLLERLGDGGVVIGAHLTAKETARSTAGRVPPPVTRLMTELTGPVDRARFDAPSTTDDDAGLAWALTDAALDRLPPSWSVRLAPIRHPRRALRRLRATRDRPRRRERWTAEIPASALVVDPGAQPVIAGHEIESRIGTGSTAVVYRARDLATGRAVAVKVFAVDVSGGSFDRQRFAWEARVAQLVSGQPNLPEVLASGLTDNGQPYLVTKLYERGTLLRRVQRGGALSSGEVASVGRQVATALETLHRNSILHGDVKPENVFIDDDGSVVLGDLGSAWLRADGGPAAAMTPPYAAPEVWLGHAPTVASDIYSLGLTLMFAASGRVPAAGSPPSEDEILAAFGSDMALPLLEISPRRRPHSALLAARLLGADEPLPSLTRT
ncbi:MAG: protein kinase [Ilumatobacteraceae bacterium]